MDIIKFLRKIGMLRYGARSYKQTDFKGHNVGMILDDFYDYDDYAIGRDKDKSSSKKQKDDTKSKDRDDE
ncbi:hypothetical protein MNB_SV-6-1462 [hydrothermal vent metagenome]|uniref:Uncharacterized protein n=1 Tax=hydrothermal vent metagenome TaxID=652676 RepID=A0A1W1BCB7_9ZZZZ